MRNHNGLEVSKAPSGVVAFVWCSEGWGQLKSLGREIQSMSSRTWQKVCVPGTWEARGKEDARWGGRGEQGRPVEKDVLPTVRSWEFLLITPGSHWNIESRFLNSHSGFLWRKTGGEPSGNGETPWDRGVLTAWEKLGGDNLMESMAPGRGFCLGSEVRWE